MKSDFRGIAAMMGKLISCAVLLLLVTVPAPAGAREIPEGVTVAAYHPLVTAVEGNVKIKGTKFKVWEPAQVGTLLLSGDIIKTEAGASAEVQFLSGRIQLYENSVMIIPSTGVQLRKKDIKEVVIQDGSAFFDINPMGVKREFEFKTRNVQGGVKGTLFTVTYREESTSVNVYDGVVAVSDVERDSETREELKVGMSLRVRKKSDFGKIKTFDPSSALEKYMHHIAPGLDKQGLPSDSGAKSSNKGVRKRGNGKSGSVSNTINSGNVNNADKAKAK